MKTTIINLTCDFCGLETTYNGWRDKWLARKFFQIKDLKGETIEVEVALNIKPRPDQPPVEDLCGTCFSEILKRLVK